MLKFEEKKSSDTIWTSPYLTSGHWNRKWSETGVGENKTANRGLQEKQSCESNRNVKWKSVSLRICMSHCSSFAVCCYCYCCYYGHWVRFGWLNGLLLLFWFNVTLLLCCWMERADDVIKRSFGFWTVWVICILNWRIVDLNYAAELLVDTILWISNIHPILNILRLFYS